MASVQPKNAITARKFGILEAYKRNADAVLETPVGATWKVQAPMPHDDTATAVPYGYCHCGCGRKTPIAKRTKTDRGHVKGEPMRFCDGHYIRTDLEKNRLAVRILGDGTASVAISSRKYPGLHALVDECDVDLIGRHIWTPKYRHGNFYAETRIRNDQGKMRPVLMHRLILGLGPGDPEVDHANGNGLDNRRANIRPCTRTQNQANKKRLPANKSSRYRGVTWNKLYQKWQAGIGIDGKSKTLGRFTSEEEAGRAYDRAAAERFGEFANLNFPPDAE